MIIYIYRFYYVFKEYFNKNYDNSLIFLAASRNLEPKLEKRKLFCSASQAFSKK